MIFKNLTRIIMDRSQYFNAYTPWDLIPYKKKFGTRINKPCSDWSYENAQHYALNRTIIRIPPRW